MPPKNKKPRFRYTEQEWERIISNLKSAGFKNNSSFVRSRINDIHVYVMNNPSPFYIGNKKKYAIRLDDDTLEKVIQIEKHTGKSVCSIIKTLILDPLLQQH